MRWPGIHIPWQSCCWICCRSPAPLCRPGPAGLTTLGRTSPEQRGKPCPEHTNELLHYHPVWSTCSQNLPLHSYITRSNPPLKYSFTRFVFSIAHFYYYFLPCSIPPSLKIHTHMYKILWTHQSLDARKYFTYIITSLSSSDGLELSILFSPPSLKRHTNQDTSVTRCNRSIYLSYQPKQ